MSAHPDYPMEHVEESLIRDLLAIHDAHVKLLAAYRTGSLRPPTGAIDLLHRKRSAPVAARMYLDSLMAREPTQ